MQSSLIIYCHSDKPFSGVAIYPLFRGGRRTPFVRRGDLLFDRYVSMLHFKKQIPLARIKRSPTPFKKGVNGPDSFSNHCSKAGFVVMTRKRLARFIGVTDSI